MNEDIAPLFLASKCEHDDDVGILVHFNSASSAIAHSSAVPDEDEVLFAREATFRACSVNESMEDNVWIVSLSLKQDNNQQL